MLKRLPTHCMLLRYSIGLVAAAAITAICSGAVPGLRASLLIAAVALATRFGGWGPGVLSTVVSLFLVLVVIPVRGLHTDEVHIVCSMAFLGVATLVLVLLGSLNRTAAALRKSSVQGLAILAMSEDAIVLANEEQTISVLNPAAEKMFGYSTSKIVGKPLEVLLPERFRHRHFTLVEPLSHCSEVLGSMNRCGTIYGLRSDGSEFPADASICQIDCDGGKLMIVRLRDVTARQCLEEQLCHSQKLETVGRLAAGMAHDFNNLLEVIVGCTYLVQCDHADKARVLSAAGQIMAAAEKAGSLTRQLLAFTSKQVQKPQVIDLNDIAASLGKMIPRLVSEEVEVTVVPAVGLKNIKADPSQLEQVIMNLVVNARDAMPRGGRLTIETANVYLGQEDARDKNVPPGAYVLLAVSDTGCGMDEQVRARIFEPFFTTKQAGKGTGLGLATVRRIVGQNNGYISLHSEPGQGTTFNIYFPATTPSCAHLQASRPSRAAKRGTETVLLVEDEQHLRELLLHVLRGKGYTVLSAGTGADALQLAAQHDGSPDLLITDVILPEMRGPQLAETLSQRYPTMRIIYLSGFGSDVLNHRGSLPHNTTFLQKPFTPDLLLHRIRESLEGTSGAGR